MGEETQENVFLLMQKTFFLRASSPNLTCAVGTSDPICTIMWTRTASAFSVTDSSTCVVAAYVPEPAHASVSQFGLQLVAPPAPALAGAEGARAEGGARVLRRGQVGVAGGQRERKQGDGVPHRARPGQVLMWADGREAHAGGSECDALRTRRAGARGELSALRTHTADSCSCFRSFFTKKKKRTRGGVYIDNARGVLGISEGCTML